MLYQRADAYHNCACFCIVIYFLTFMLLLICIRLSQAEQ